MFATRFLNARRFIHDGCLPFIKTRRMVWEAAERRATVVATLRPAVIQVVWRSSVAAQVVARGHSSHFK
ncbi:hypothetical protein FQR65_LT00645 [Abscondita terminalis]|nr:hypothetical protein FQR65_LT00645 [Abscondita terminalis]